NTAVAPTPTNTGVLPTLTNTATRTNTVVAPTSTGTPTRTNTAVPPTVTHTGTSTPAVTATRTVVTSPTATASHVVTRTATATSCTGRVSICHLTGSPQHAYREITINCHALPAHLAHGDLYPVPPEGCPAGPPPPRPHPFNDVDPSSPFYWSILDLYDMGAISGY